MRILVADDDATLRGLVAYVHRQEGYVVLDAADGPSTLRVLDAEAPDLVFLDLGMPRMGGFEVLRKMRADECETPVLVLTARSDFEDHVRALDLGADDYMTKPFSSRALIAHIGAILRRANREKPPVLATGEFHLDLEAETVSVSGATPVRLTHLEFRLLQYLASHAGRLSTPNGSPGASGGRAEGATASSSSSSCAVSLDRGSDARCSYLRRFISLR